MTRPLLLILLLLLSACSPPEKPPLRIAISPWPGYEFLYLAEQLKLFEAEGVEVQIVQFSSPIDSRRAYATGQVDGFCSSPDGVLIVREQSQRQPRIVYVTDYSSGGDLIVSRAGITHAEQLAGKRVGVEAGTINNFVLAHALEKANLSSNSAQRVYLAQSDMLSALLSNDIDAAVTYPPYSIAMLKQPHLREIFSTRQIPGEILDVIALDAEVIATRKDDVRAMLRGLEAAYEYARQNPQKAYTIMAAREGITVDEFRNSILNDLYLLRAVDQAFYLGPDQRLFKALQSAQRLLLDNGEIKQAVDLTTLVMD
jgi:NitT/TauT family transport system substrate-binding protein